MDDADYEQEKDRDDDNRFIITSSFAFQKDRLEVAHCAPVLVDTRNNEEEPRPFGAAAAKPDAI